MPTTRDTSSLASQPDPQPDRGGKPVPERIAELLDTVRILIGYGRHMAETIEGRAIRRGFATIAQFFGTAALPVMLAHIQRGIMRAVALERVLLARAARGRDLVILAPRVHSRRTPPPAAPAAPGDVVESDARAPAGTQSAAAPAAPEPAPKPKPRPSRQRGPEEPLTLANLPSMAQIEAEVRRQPHGRTIANICRDLGIAPTLCHYMFWNQLFEAMRCYRGSHSNLIGEMRLREKRLDAEQWMHPNLGWPEESRDGVRRVLGFFIGEPSVDPFRPEPATPEPATPGLTLWTSEGPAIIATATGPP